MENYNELMQVAQLLKTVKVDGDFWVLMATCVGTIVKIAEAIKPKEGEKNDAINNGA